MQSPPGGKLSWGAAVQASQAARGGGSGTLTPAERRDGLGTREQAGAPGVLPLWPVLVGT